MAIPFRDRRDAGRQLAARLSHYAGRPDVIVLGLPRGGVPVAYEVASALQAPLDAFLVRKLGVPGHEELAMGAIASGGLRVLNEPLVEELRISEAVINAVEARERQEMRRRDRLYRGSRPAPDVSGKTVIIVDDGLATGATFRAAALALRQLDPAWIVGAVPVASADICHALEADVDEMICAETPEPFFAVGLWYDDFGPTSDEEVTDLLRRAQEWQAATYRSPGASPIGNPGLPELIEDVARPVTGASDDYDDVMAMIGDAQLVLIGEASHGTHDFYDERARLTRRLIEEAGFTAVVVEADWPDAFRVNRYVRGESDDSDSDSALGDFNRFPRWMWRNTVVAEFVSWLRAYNDALPPGNPKTGFYGMDLYSLSASIDAVIDYLDRVDPEAAARARARYACFDHFGDDPQVYGYATVAGTAESCENEAVGQLIELQSRATELARRDGRVAQDEFFFAEQNARLAKNAEAYYRAMFRGRVSSWNLRDRHMAGTIDALIAHLQRQDGRARLVVWAHNSHIGDARATEMGESGELNVGQLARERYGDSAFLIGFSTYTGTVTAASDWDAPGRRRVVRPGLPGSYEALFHDVGLDRFVLPLHRPVPLMDHLREPRLQRAIGVIYRPETERFSHYMLARLADQFDVMIHLDETSAVVPLDAEPAWHRTEDLAETFPFGE